jgi:flagellar hook-basal body complex protein FliE
MPELSSPAADKSTGGDFSAILSNVINQVSGAHLGAEENVSRFLRGDNEELHTVVLDAQRAELEFQMFLQVRNKVVQAYQEIMRMQV